jgi:hypothetical protein
MALATFWAIFFTDSSGHPAKQQNLVSLLQNREFSFPLNVLLKSSFAAKQKSNL